MRRNAISTLAVGVTMVAAVGLAGPSAHAAGVPRAAMPATADVTLTVHPDALGVTNIGSFSGRLVATGAGGVAVQTGFGVTTETESFDVKVKVIDRNGNPAGADDTSQLNVDFTPLDVSQPGQGGSTPDQPTFVGGMATFRVAKGRYGVSNVVVTQDPRKPGFANASGTMFAVPSITVDHPGISLTFDARRAHEVGTLLVDAQGAQRFSSEQVEQFLVRTPDGDLPIEVAVSGGATNPMVRAAARGRRSPVLLRVPEHRDGDRARP